jgi:hypothetical protein
MIRQKTPRGLQASVPESVFPDARPERFGIGDAADYDLLTRAEQVVVFVEELFRQFMNIGPHTLFVPLK